MQVARDFVIKVTDVSISAIISIERTILKTVLVNCTHDIVSLRRNYNKNIRKNPVISVK